MKRAADFRAEARAALKGHWRLAVGVGFLAMVLGGIAGVGGLDVNFVMVEGNFQMTLDVCGQCFSGMAVSFCGCCSGCDCTIDCRIVCRSWLYEIQSGSD